MTRTATEAPISRRDVEQEFRERAEREWFKDHRVAEHSIVETPGKTKIELLRWRKPESGICAITYVVIGNTLYVSGDMHEATYQWSSAVSLAWIAGLDQHYFASKCMASPQGRQFKTWDRRSAMQAVTDYFDEQVKFADVEIVDCGNCDGVGIVGGRDCPACGGSGDFERPKTDPSRLVFDEHDGWSALEDDDHAWVAWLREHGDDAFGSDHWEWTAGVGKVIDPACIAHLVGLKMAVAQLKSAAAAPQKAAES